MEPYKKPVLTVPNTRNALLNRTKIGLLPVPTVPDTGNALLNRTKWWSAACSDGSKYRKCPSEPYKMVSPYGSIYKNPVSDRTGRQFVRFRTGKALLITVLFQKMYGSEFENCISNRIHLFLCSLNGSRALS